METAVSASSSVLVQSQDYKKIISEYGNVWLKILLKGLRKISVGRLRVTLPGGEILEFVGQEQEEKTAALDILDLSFARSVLKGGDIGLGEAYMAGYWSSPDLCQLLELAILNEKSISEVISGSWMSRTVDFVRCLLNANTKRGSRRNISYHYDLGNRFYEQWLDESMTYSSALFDGETVPLSKAQENKYKLVFDTAEVPDEGKILEIGCGWGGFAEYATQNSNASVHGLTLSEEQLAYAKVRLKTLGHEKRATFDLQDYRDHASRYDAIVSIEMFEAVGENNWPQYFKALRRNLKAGGKAAIQVITIDESRYEAYRKTPDFIQKYIFPGGFLPSKTAFAKAASEYGFKTTIRKEFGLDYATTLRIWAESFQKRWSDIEPLGFDKRFRRMWDFYLKYCEAGFRQKTLDVVIFELA
ncbi:SAM-dependent methyltransferase [Sneathiella limimaris]|uniref:SAM-dependent methyltransferase n=1 Tax=Sneathiella limimaris TaxID=1964213 RepID=UPI00146C9666|nr:cyclopropane-fatty-acyl-phospholipid synthase family protein [Sneathiella limimaris]